MITIIYWYVSHNIEYITNCIKSHIIIAETDDEAVGFYRKCDFEVNNLGEKYPNVIRYECEKYLS